MTPMPDDLPATIEPALFEAVIVPHRSLSPRGLRLLLAAIAGLCGLIALRFVLIGAWPVIGFAVVEVGVAILLIWLNAVRAQAREIILLDAAGLRVVRTDRHGRRQERCFSTAWLNVVLAEVPGRVPRLLLTARGTREEIAASLGEDEKRDLADALQAALHRTRNPRFDNPQLAE